MSYAKAEFSMLVNVFAAPLEAFRSLRERASVWFPLILLVTAWIAVWNWFYHAVDYSWFINHLIANETLHAPADQKEAITQSIVKLKPGALIIISSVSVIVVFLALSLVMSLYLLVVAAVFDDKYRLKHWFSLALWASMPSLLAIVAMVANFYLASAHQIAPEQLNPLTLNNLLFHVGPDSGYKRLLDSVDLTLMWSWLIMILGYREWTRRSFAASSAIILTPVAILYGVWIAVIQLG
jgi:hypothetical protein